MISPGIAHAETITTFHSARFMEDPKAVEGELTADGVALESVDLQAPLPPPCAVGWFMFAGNLDGNPLHLDQIEIVGMLQTEDNPVLGLNVVIDDHRQLSFVRASSIYPSNDACPISDGRTTTAKA